MAQQPPKGDDRRAGGKTVRIGQAVETDTALPIAREKRVQIGQAIEIDAALPILSAVTADSLPVVTLQQVLLFRGDTPDGRLVQSVALPWFTIMRMIQHDPDEIYRIDARKWEELIAGAYSESRLFDEVILTPRSGDRGRDVIATKNGIGAIRVVDQVKAYRPEHLVTADEVRAMVGVLSLDPNVSKGYVTTTSDFAPRLRDDPDIKRVIPYRLELKAKPQLLEWLSAITAGNSRGEPSR